MNHISKSKCKFPNVDDLLVRLREWLKVSLTEDRKEKQRQWKSKSRQKQRENDDLKETVQELVDRLDAMNHQQRERDHRAGEKERLI